MTLDKRLQSKNVRRIPLDPVMASVIGVNETLFLTQLQFWISSKEEAEDMKTFRDGRMWVFNTYEKWHEQFPFMSVRTIRRTVENLEKQGLIITERHNQKGYDKTKWYTIDYETLSKIEDVLPDEDNSPCGQNGHIDVAKVDSPCGQNGQTNTIEYYIDNSRENSNKMEHRSRNARSVFCSDGSINYDFLRNQVDTSLKRLGCYDDSYLRNETQRIIYYYYHRFQDVIGEPHIILKQETMDSVVEKILEGSELVTDVCFETYQELIDRFFQSNIESDYHITHFVSGFIRDYRWYEAEMGGGVLSSYA